MKVGDKVYYLHTNQNGQQTKFPAVVLDVDDTAVTIRIGKMDTLSQQIFTAEYTVATDKLSERSTLCNYEDELSGDAA
ncbi:MAG: hypothetical protein AAF434_00475 [Pseudomonadota bacterium]